MSDLEEEAVSMFYRVLLPKQFKCSFSKQTAFLHHAGEDISTVFLYMNKMITRNVHTSGKNELLHSQNKAMKN